MKRWLRMTFAISSSLWLSLMLVAGLGTGAVAVRFAIEYIVNTQRNVTHWVDYETVEPVSSVYPIGSQPVFFSKATWHREVIVAWPDVMWCKPTEGPNAGTVRRLTASAQNRKEVRDAGTVGHYDEAGNLAQGSSSGFWQWDGPVPQYAATCWLDPNPVLYPSPLVERYVHVPPTTPFEFR